MSYFLLFIFSNISLLAFMHLGSAIDLAKTDKTSAYSIMPGIPFLPLLFVLATYVFQMLGFNSSIKVAYIINCVVLSISVLGVVFVVIKTKTT